MDVENCPKLKRTHDYYKLNGLSSNFSNNLSLLDPLMTFKESLNGGTFYTSFWEEITGFF